MKHIKTFESYVGSLTEGLNPAKMKELIAEVAELLAGQLADEGMEANEVEDFLEEYPNAAESTLEGLEDKYGTDLVNMWPKMKADVIKKVQEILDESVNEGRSDFREIEGKDLEDVLDAVAYLNGQGIPEVEKAVKGKAPYKLIGSKSGSPKGVGMHMSSIDFQENPGGVKMSVGEFIDVLNTVLDDAGYDKFKVKILK
jgi:hypothetical protein